MKKGYLLLIGMLALVGCGQSGGGDNSLTNDSLNNPSSDTQNVQNKESEGFEFDLSNDKNSYILYSVGECTDKNVVIPSTYKDLPVTVIGQKAFMNQDSLSSVVIPNSITTIENAAFYGCSSLTSLEIPNSVTSIGELAFFRCSSLTTIEFPDSIEFVDNFIIDECDSLTYTEYGNCLYLGNKGNPYLMLVKAKDTSVTEVTISNNTKIIMYAAFHSCKSLTSIDIPDNIKFIGDWAFTECESITSMSIPNGVKTISYCMFDECESLSSVNIPNSVTSIGTDAFDDCISLTSVVIPSSVTNIEFSAFGGCKSLSIYCEASSKPVDWNDDWNYSERPVYWGE